MSRRAFLRNSGASLVAYCASSSTLVLSMLGSAAVASGLVGGTGLGLAIKIKFSSGKSIEDYLRERSKFMDFTHYEKLESKFIADGRIVFRTERIHPQAIEASYVFRTLESQSQFLHELSKIKSDRYLRASLGYSAFAKRFTV